MKNTKQETLDGLEKLEQDLCKIEGLICGYFTRVQGQIDIMRARLEAEEVRPDPLQEFISKLRQNGSDQ